MKILLIQTPNIQGSFLNLPGKEIPLGLCYLASYLKSRGMDQVAILDLDFLGGVSPHLEQSLREFTPDLVGITSYTTNIAIAGQIAAIVKRCLPNARTVIGGFHASALPEQTMAEFDSFDYLVFGEGEVTLFELATALDREESPNGIAGLVQRTDGDLVLGPARELLDTLDELPFPDRSLVDVKAYVPDPGNYFQLPSTGILFSRGCPFKCTYCSKSVFHDRIRYREVEPFIREVEQCIDDFGIRDFRLEDEGPTVNPKKVAALSQAILDRGLRITWNCFSRVDTVKPELLSLMKRAGCYHITYGVESAEPETLKRIGKRFTLEQVEQAVRWTKAEGIECKVNFIFGFPWETVEQMQRTVKYAVKLSPDLVSFNLFKPLPGSRLYDSMRAEGTLLHRAWDQYFVTGESLLFEAAFTEADLRRIIQHAFIRFHFRPRFILQRLIRLFRHPKRELTTISAGLSILLREIFGGRGASRLEGAKE
jgi:radical SAM superfamily enzyme YgiQ (UPF0313 family)